MKKGKRIIATLLSVLMLMSCFCLTVFAEDSVSVNFLNVNVAGLPNFKALIGQDGTDVNANQAALGKTLNASAFDVIAVQEDFGYHDTLSGAMTNYAYQTISSGSVPGGDGLNVFTKNIPVYDAKRVEWNCSYGGIAEGDALTPKGILYTVLDLGNGIYLDFYDLHADAFDGDGNALTRVRQYRQLMDLVNTQSKDRPVVITGDFNTSLCIKNAGDNGADEVYMREGIIDENGFKDAWIELHNDGNYDDFSAWAKSGVSYWGHWDSVEKFYYRDGGGVTITPEQFQYIDFKNDAGVSISDHNGANCTFTFTKTAEFKEDTREHKVTNFSELARFFNMAKWIFKDLVFVINHFDELKSLIGLA